ncbi:barstar family protein [Leisingera sp. SS27]|uniref:barstar family protein n=1 Tax=Leisingera sp. SS27 TaxID=2979462 RepID=UPI00232B793C|nr:barstar family protein [Leisingera sp. SS27]MDC0657167.1 barstar family protein [Leisingera sp. SS27]
MKQISADISACRTADEVYDVLLAVLEAPDWHGRNLDALWDCLVNGDNGLCPPFSITFNGSERLPPSLVELPEKIQKVFDEAREVESIEAFLVLA